VKPIGPGDLSESQLPFVIKGFPIRERVNILCRIVQEVECRIRRGGSEPFALLNLLFIEQ
jgi:hypothetical protein